MMDSDNARIVYADIIDHPHHQSETRAHMPLYDRAAQFSAFDALAGYSDMIAEEARVTEEMIDLDEDTKALLNRKLSMLADLLEDGYEPTISFTVYVPDQKKQGGRYEVIKDSVKRIDTVNHQIVLSSKNGHSRLNKRIDFSDVVSVDGDLLDYMETEQ